MSNDPYTVEVLGPYGRVTIPAIEDVPWPESRDGYLPASDIRVADCREMSPLMQAVALRGASLRRLRGQEDLL